MKDVQYQAEAMFSLQDLCNEEKVPIVLYSDTPKVSELHVERSGCSLDLQSGEVTVEDVSVLIVPQYTYQYVVFEPGNKIQETVFIFEEPNVLKYQQALNEEIARLENVYPSVWKDMALADYSENPLAYDRHYQWSRTTMQEISAVDDDDDNYTWEFTLNRDYYRSKYDYETGRKYWLTEWSLQTAFDQDDYKASYLTWVGPWVTYRWLKHDDDLDLELWEYAPTGTVGSYSYSITQGIKVGPSGPVYMLGASHTVSGSEVTTTDLSSIYYAFAKWNEDFVGPTYIWYPLLYGPCLVSHTSYLTHFCAEWRSNGLYHLDATQSYKARVHYDKDFFLVNWFTLGWYRYSHYISYQNEGLYYWGN
jgi:hypothetical protein